MHTLPLAAEKGQGLPWGCIPLISKTLKPAVTEDTSFILDEFKISQHAELCRALGRIARVGFKQPELVQRIVPDVIGYLADSSPEVCSRACWAVGQIGFKRPQWVQAAAPQLARLMEHPEARVREEAIWALGRIGRAKPEIVEGYLDLILRHAHDENPKVRLSVIWACENIAAQRPEWFADHISTFACLLDDPNVEYVRREAPEIFHVIGKRRPELVECAIPKLAEKLDDEDRVVRLHAQGALAVIHQRLKKE